jgi:hypothetical protein
VLAKVFVDIKLKVIGESAGNSYLQFNFDFKASNKQPFVTINFLGHLEVQISLNFVIGVKS